MPSNTLFSNFEPNMFGSLSIKGKTSGEDFYRINLDSLLKSNSSDEFYDILNRATITGENIELDFEENIELDCEYYRRDGIFEDSQLYAVWDRKDIEGLIEKLKLCLISGEK